MKSGHYNSASQVVWDARRWMADRDEPVGYSLLKFGPKSKPRAMVRVLRVARDFASAL